ncbi:MAG: L-lactate permease, partial [Acidobacteria bacterium]|nr:L-lactate permease [Acidobacteriota bacterium]
FDGDSDPSSRPAQSKTVAQPVQASSVVTRAWMPWLFLSIAVILWGLAPVKAFLNGGPQGLAAYRSGARPYVSGILSPTWNVPLLHRAVFRDYPVVPSAIDRARINDPAYRNERAEAAVFTLNWLSATGTAILLAALATAAFLCVAPKQLLSVALLTMRRMRTSLLTIMLMLALGFVTRYGGTDATLGLAFTKTGVLYQPRPHRDRQQHGRRHGQDDRCAKHRGCHRLDRPGGARRQDSSIRLLAQPRARGHHGRDRRAAGLCVSVDGALISFQLPASSSQLPAKN